MVNFDRTPIWLINFIKQIFTKKGIENYESMGDFIRKEYFEDVSMHAKLKYMNIPEIMIRMDYDSQMIFKFCKISGYLELEYDDDEFENTPLHIALANK